MEVTLHSPVNLETLFLANSNFMAGSSHKYMIDDFFEATVSCPVSMGLPWSNNYKLSQKQLFLS